jgi:predicted metal-dependent hydrolase
MEPAVIDKLVRSRRRTLALLITPDAQLVVRAPNRAPLTWIHRIVNEKLAWIRDKQQEAREAWARRISRRFVQGDRFLFLGEERMLTVVPGSDAPLRLIETGFVIGALGAPAREQFETFYRAQAQALIGERASVMSAAAGLSYRGLRISGAKTRWGSCSAKGSLNFAWRLVLAPRWVIDYVVAHEFAHLSEHNHSRRFWTRVAALYPDYKAARRWLRQHHHRLTL